MVAKPKLPSILSNFAPGPAICNLNIYIGFNRSSSMQVTHCASKLLASRTGWPIIFLLMPIR